LVATTGIASGVDGKQCGQRKDAVDPRVGNHGSRCGVNAGLGAAPAGRVGGYLVVDLEHHANHAYK
jgi:hypothetical protein